MSKVEVKPELKTHDFQVDVMERLTAYKNEEDETLRLSYNLEGFQIVTNLEVEE